MKILSIFGTRPEAIKMAPVVKLLAREKGIASKVCVTAQHRQMLDQVLALFEIVPDIDLDVMTPGQDLFDIVSRSLMGLRNLLKHESPDLVLVQGDTTTTYTAALAAFYLKIPVGHIEAGLRTGNLYSPWPEEGNRLMTTCLTTLHFAPTEGSKENLLRSGVPAHSITVTGNTVIDALFLAADLMRLNPPYIPSLPDFLQANTIHHENAPRMVLITAHRRENFGQGFLNICNAIKKLALKFNNVHFVYPVHLNPNVQGPVFEILCNCNNIHLLEPQSYLPFVALMSRADLILTDSGGIQEEAPSLGKMVFVMRNTTERPEAIEAGTAKMIGTEEESIIQEVTVFLSQKRNCDIMVKKNNPYGDGHATERILEAIKAHFGSIQK